jgi:hypothetical protein
MTVMHKLTAGDKERRLELALWAMDEDAVLHNTWFADEAYFHVNGVVNKQNVRFWARGNPQILHEKETYGQKVNVWAAISSHGIMGPFICETVLSPNSW